jgi:hypothetical protein
MTVEVREVRIGGKLKSFLNVVDEIYRDDPCYVRPLDMDIKERLSKKNPFFEHGEGVALTAHRRGRCVGRCTAQIDREHLTRYQDACGFFGFIDTVDDEQVARALLDHAAAWLRERRMKRMRGPMSLSVNEEIGLLVDGFDTPPYFMMQHHRAYQGALVEAAGLHKVKDLFAWKYQVGNLPDRAVKAHASVEAMAEVKARPVDLKHIERDVRIVMDVYNDAWSDNWGFVPLTEKELAKMASDMKLILIPDLTQIIEIDGEPIAVALALPNLNEMIGDLRGKLLPFGAIKLLYRLKLRGPTSARLIILGIRKKLRQVRRYAALSTFMYVEMHKAGERLHIPHGELSWTLEDNAPVNVGIRFMGGKHYKTYRLYEREL